MELPPAQLQRGGRGSQQLITVELITAAGMVKRKDGVFEVIGSYADRYWIAEAGGGFVFNRQNTVLTGALTSLPLSSFVGASRSSKTGRKSCLKSLTHYRLNREAALEQKTFEWEGRFFTGDGQLRWLRIESTPIVREDGNIRWFGVTQDITERTYAEKRYQSLFNYSNDAIYVHEIGSDDVPGRIIEVNEQACRLSQYSREELLQMSIKDISTEKNLSVMPQRARKLIEEKQLTFEAEDVRRDGSVIPVEISAFSYTEGGKDFVVSSVRDITGRKQAEKALTQKSQLLEKAQTLANLGSWEWDIVHDTWYFSEQWKKIHGVFDNNFDTSKLMEIAHPEDAPYIEKAFFDAKEHGKTYDIEHRIIRADNREIRYVKALGNLELDPDTGRSVRMVGAVQEITDRKLAEEKIQKQLTEKDILLREVHHRVKNNVANIEGLLSLQAESTAHAEVRAALLDAISRVRSVRVLYDKLLLSQDLHEVSIKNYAESLIDSLVMVFDSGKNITIEKHIADLEIDAKTAFTIGVILNELLTNVFKYAFGDREDGRVSVSIDKEESGITLIIQDNGRGFDERALENKSPGFGLAIVKMLVEQLCGTYSRSNDHGAKSVVRFEI